MRMNDMFRYDGRMYRVICIRAELDVAIGACIAVDGTIINRVYVTKGTIMTREQLIERRKQEIMDMLESTIVEGRPMGKAVRPLVSKQKMNDLRQELLALEDEGGEEEAA